MKRANALGGHFITEVLADSNLLVATATYFLPRVGDLTEYHSGPGGGDFRGAFQRVAVTVQIAVNQNAGGP